jgi:hypothetical protein
MDKVIGLDISTNTTGYSIMDEDEKLLKYGFIDTSKTKDWFEKTEIFTLQMKQLSEEFSVIKIGIEDILGKFSGGRTSAKTIISLARFNALASYKCYELFNLKPEHINVLRARKLAFGHSIPRNSGLNAKEYVLKRSVEWYPELILPKMKTKDKIAKEAYDITDSIIIAKAILRL